MSMDTSDQKSLHKARQAQTDSLSEYVRNFLSKAHRSDISEKVSCPTCGQDNSSHVFSKNGGEYTYCPNCEHIYLSNPFTEETLLKFYSGYPSNTLSWHLNETDFYRTVYQKGLDLLLTYNTGNKILDIGCSSGLFLSVAKERGLSCFGVEPNLKESKYAQDHGIEVLGSSIKEITNGSTFDIITLWDVLEHISDPVSYLKTLHDFIQDKSSIIFVQVPSCDSLAARILREECNMFDGIEHLTLFGLKSLDLAFSQAGFEPISKSTIISERHATVNYLNYSSDPYLDEPQSSIYKDFIHNINVEELGFGYKIQGLYRPV